MKNSGGGDEQHRGLKAAIHGVSRKTMCTFLWNDVFVDKYDQMRIPMGIVERAAWNGCTTTYVKNLIIRRVGMQMSTHQNDNAKEATSTCKYYAEQDSSYPWRHERNGPRLGERPRR